MTHTAPSNSIASAPEREYTLVDEHEVARMTGLSVRTLQRWRVERKADRRGPPWYRVAGAVRYNRPEVVEFILAGLCAQREPALSENRA
jgi:hypothetical protein